MNVYEFSFDGMWINPMVIVIAENREQAEIYAKTEVKANGFDPETVELIDEKPVADGVVVLFQDGDY